MKKFRDGKFTERDYWVSRFAVHINRVIYAKVNDYMCADEKYLNKWTMPKGGTKMGTSSFVVLSSRHITHLTVDHGFQYDVDTY